MCVCSCRSLDLLSLAPQLLDCAIWGSLKAKADISSHPIAGMVLDHERGPDVLNWLSKYTDHRELWTQREKGSGLLPRDLMDCDVAGSCRGWARTSLGCVKTCMGTYVLLTEGSRLSWNFT